jgi:hypothetical protein
MIRFAAWRLEPSKFRWPSYFLISESTETRAAVEPGFRSWG